MISDPILHLASVATQISESGRYSFRAVKTFDDETGQLIDQCNDMMEKINEREPQLKRARIGWLHQTGLAIDPLPDHPAASQWARTRWGRDYG